MAKNAPVDKVIAPRGPHRVVVLPDSILQESLTFLGAIMHSNKPANEILDGMALAMSQCQVFFKDERLSEQVDLQGKPHITNSG